MNHFTATKRLSCSCLSLLEVTYKNSLYDVIKILKTSKIKNMIRAQLIIQRDKKTSTVMAFQIGKKIFK